MARGVFNVLGSADEGAFDRLRKNLNPDWVEQALDATGTATIRRRRLPAEQVVWLVLGMALYRRLPIDELVEHLDLVLPGTGKARLAKSAIAQARARLGDEPMKWLFERCSSKWGHESARRYQWRGLALYGVDGTTVRVPDSKENREHFGSQRGREETLSGYPLARIVTLMALRSHILVAANFGPYDDERHYAKELWPEVPDDSLLIVDRNFLAANILLVHAAAQNNRHWLTRAKSTTTWKVVKKLGRGDELIELETSSEARKQNPDLPRVWPMRAIHYRRPGFRPQTLLTSLIDAEVFPAEEIRALYHERWDMELGYDEVKTDMLEREETIRSKKPKGVMQELWAIGLAYNLIRLEMERIAAEVDLPPSRISFVASLRFIRDEWMWAAVTRSPGTLPRKLVRLREQILRFVLPPRRSHRSFPRAVKLKMSNYDRKRPTVPRSARKTRRAVPK
jgi:Insertion element 4 transposase N-terminal/Transposase DDE domain